MTKEWGRSKEHRDLCGKEQVPLSFARLPDEKYPCRILFGFICAGNTKVGSVTVPLTSCLTGLDKSVLQIKQKLSVVIHLIPKQSWLSMVQ